MAYPARLIDKRFVARHQFMNGALTKKIVFANVHARFRTSHGL
jgi:hypothetical protein